jgi:hypothetical protein
LLCPFVIDEQGVPNFLGGLQPSTLSYSLDVSELLMM